MLSPFGTAGLVCIINTSEFNIHSRVKLSPVVSEEQLIDVNLRHLSCLISVLFTE